MGVQRAWRQNAKSDVPAKLSSNLDNWIHLYEKRLLAMALSILNDEFLAQDCVQEAFIKAGLKEHQLQNPEYEFTWLSRIVINICKSQLRTNWRKKVLLKESALESGTMDSYPSDGSEDLYRQVLQLPGKYKMVILLYYYNDLPAAEVAAILQIKESTCKVWLHRARLKLREEIGGE